MKTILKESKNEGNFTSNGGTDDVKAFLKKKKTNQEGGGEAKKNFKDKSFKKTSSSSSKFNGKSKSAVGYKTNTGFGGEKVQRRVVDEATKDLRRLYNKLMLKEVKPNKKSKNKKEAENKVEIINKILKHIDNNYKEYCYKHDTCRILQGCIKFGNNEQRKLLIDNLKPYVLSLILKRYSIYLAVKIIKFATLDQTEEILKDQIYPNFSKILKNENGQVFLNFIFKNCSNKVQELLENYYFTKYLKYTFEFISANLTSKKQKMNIDSGEAVLMEMQMTITEEKIITNIKDHLEKQLEKKIHKTFVFQSFLSKIFDLLPLQTQSYLTELFDDDLNDFLYYKKGVELACKFFIVAQAKTRKKIVKNLKKVTEDPENPQEIDLVPVLLDSETTALFLIKIINSLDDTKLLSKHILKPMMPIIKENFLTSKSSQKVVKNIVNLNCKSNTPNEQEILGYIDNTTSKKDPEKRQEEVWSIIGKELHDEIFLNEDVIYKYFSDNVFGNILADIFSFYISAIGAIGKDYLSTLSNAITEVIKADYNQTKTSLELSILASKTGHFSINRIIKKMLDECSDKAILKQFIDSIIAVLLSDLKGFLESRAIFIIVRICENQQYSENLQKELKKHKKFIEAKSKEQGLIGYQHLNKLVI